MRSGAMADHRMSANDMGDKVADLLEDPNMGRFSATRILEGLNNSIAEFCARTRGVFDSIDIEFVDGTRDYSIKAAIDADGSARELGMIERIGLYDGKTNDWPYPFLRGKELYELDAFGLTYYGDGPAQAWYNDLYGWYKISILPVPDDDYDAGPPKDNGVYVLYSCIPAKMTYTDPDFGNLDSEIPTLALLPICYGAAAMILEYGGEKEIERATELFEEFERGILEAIQGVSLALSPNQDVEPC